MDNLYGYKLKDLINLAELINQDRKVPLKNIFTEFSVKSGKAVGTVRNLYYALAKVSKTNENFAKQYLDGKPLIVERAEEFDSNSEEKLIKDVLKLKSQGNSIRNAVFILANNEPKKALRYQNKFRNVCKVKPELVEKVAKSLNMIESVSNKKIPKTNVDGVEVSDFLVTKLKKEINDLMERISQKVSNENQYLKRRVNFLELENLKLSAMLFGNQKGETIGFFNKKPDELIN